MALTTTTNSGAVTAAQTFITLAAYTAPTSGIVGTRAKPMLRMDSEYMLITDATLSPTLQVVRGYFGSSAATHKNLAGVTYGVQDDFAAEPPRSISVPTITQQSQALTATGATGSTAATVTVSAPAILACTGTSGAGINLPYAYAGAQYWVTNLMTGDLKVYSVGATINGTTGTTAVTITATGDLGSGFQCVTAGAWLQIPKAT